MLAAILLATGVLRLATDGVPALGRGLGNLGIRISRGWGVVTGRRRRVNPANYSGTSPGLGARFGGFVNALTAPFRRLGRVVTGSSGSAQRLRQHRQAAGTGLLSRLVLKIRMTRARWNRTRSTVGQRKRYWWLRFRNMLPWRR